MYTHYYKLDIDKTTRKRARIIIDEAEKEGIHICGPLGHGEPIINVHSIRLNGDASRDEDYEDFDADNYSNLPIEFCKTAHQPYDAVVTAILTSYVISRHSYHCVTSDGSFTDWVNGGGISLYERAVKPLTKIQAHRLHLMLGDSDYAPNADALAKCSDAVKGEFVMTV